MPLEVKLITTPQVSVVCVKILASRLVKLVKALRFLLLVRLDPTILPLESRLSTSRNKLHPKTIAMSINSTLAIPMTVFLIPKTTTPMAWTITIKISTWTHRARAKPKIATMEVIVTSYKHLQLRPRIFLARLVKLATLPETSYSNIFAK